MFQHPFSPAPSSTVLAVSSSTNRVQVSNGRGAQDARIHNDAGVTVWLAWGGSTVVASMSGSMSIPAGAVEVLRFEPPYNGNLWFAGITASASGNVNITLGSGL